MAAVLLALEHLRVNFPEMLAVDDLSLTVEAGDVCGLVGPKGAGKTTTMRAVSGLQECAHGSVKVAGHDLSREPNELKRRVGFIPDFSPVYDRLTAAEFLDHFARAYDVPGRRARIEDCLELAGLTEQRAVLCEGLSRGMKQRLMLAKTLLPDPQVLLLDDPACGLNPLGRLDLWKLLMQLHDAGKAVLISSRILAELSSFCNKAAILERGKLAAFGTIFELGQHMSPTRIVVKWRADQEKALLILRDAAGVENLAAAGQGATFEFEGDGDALHELLRALILQEVHVTEWRSADHDPEQVFLRPGAKAIL